MLNKKRFLTLARCLLISLFLTVFILPQAVFSQENVTALISPQNVNAESDTQKGIVKLSWGPVSGATGYNIYRKLISEDNYSRLNFSLVKGTSFDDSSVVKGKSYEYAVRAVDAAGNESTNSRVVGAPNMVMEETIEILHEGEVVDVAMPGDAITYIIDYSNKGFGAAKEVSIVHAIPKGTTFLPGTAVINSKVNAEITYFDKNKEVWAKDVKGEENISKIKFEILDDIPPVSTGKNGTASFKVSVDY